MTPEIMLFDRCLTLLSFDGLNPVSVSKLNLLEMYKGLHIEEDSILPEMRKSNASRLYSLRLYKDPSCRVRLHIHPQRDEVAQDNYIHEHSSHSASIVLAGSLVNQHFRINEGNADSDNAVYKVTPDIPRQAEGIRGGDSYDYVGPAEIERVSSHVYHEGDYYMLPGKSPVGKDRVNSFHKIGSKDLGVTLFFESFPEKSWETHSVRPTNYPKHYRKEFEENSLPTSEMLPLIHEADAKVCAALASVRKPSTILDRSKGTIAAESFAVSTPDKGKEK